MHNLIWRFPVAFLKLYTTKRRLSTQIRQCKTIFYQLICSMRTLNEIDKQIRHKRRPWELSVLSAQYPISLWLMYAKIMQKITNLTHCPHTHTHKKNITRARHGNEQGKMSTDLYLIWESSTEKHCLPWTTRRHVHLLHNLPDLGLKTHVQHPVSLI